MWPSQGRRVKRSEITSRFGTGVFRRLRSSRLIAPDKNTALVSKHERRALIDKLRIDKLRIDKLRRTYKLLKVKRIQGKPVERYQEQQDQLASLWRKKVESVSLITPDGDIFNSPLQTEVLPL